MMSKTTIIGCALCLGALSVKADSINVRTFRHVGPYPIQKPFMVDSADVNGRSFDVKSLLKTPLSTDCLNEGQNLSDGVLPPAESHALHLASFAVDNSLYTQARLTVRGVKNYTVYVDGRPHEGQTVTLEPSTHRFVIKCLTEPGESDTLSVSLEDDNKGNIRLNTSGKRLYTLNDVMNGTRFNRVDLSPDGKYLITGYVTTHNDGTRQSDLRITEVGTNRTVATTRTPVQWMPKGSRYYYVRRNTSGNELVTVDAATLAETILARNIPEGHFQVAPTEDYLLYTLRREGPKEKPDLYRILTPDDRQPGWRNRTYLAKYDLTTGMMQPLTFGYRNVRPAGISPDGKHIVFSTSKDRITRRPFNLTTVCRMNVETMTVDTLLNEAEYVAYCLPSPDFSSLLVVASGDAFDGIGLRIDEGQKSSYYDYQLYLYNIEEKQVKPLTADFNPSVASVQWCHADGCVYFTANDRDYVRLYRMEMPSGRISRLPVSEEVVKSFTVSSDASMLAYYGESCSNAHRLYTFDLKRKRETLQRDLSAELLADVSLGECHDWNYLSSRGDTICGRYYLPPRFDASRKYPMIVYYYGGCTPTDRSLESRYPLHLYAAMGYVVYVVQPSGAIGFGQEFSARHVNAWGERTADDIIEGTRRFCQEHAFVDSARVGCIGASYGGFMTQYLQTKTDLFAAAVSHAGISNITSYWGEGYWGYSYSEAASADSYPWNNPRLYTEQSPLFRADRIHTPILFLHGSADTNVPIGESIQMFTALKLLGRDAAFVTVSGENHAIADYGKRHKWQAAIFAWFAKYLQGDETWWNALYPGREL